MRPGLGFEDRGEWFGRSRPMPDLRASCGEDPEAAQRAGQYVKNSAQSVRTTAACKDATFNSKDFEKPKTFLTRRPEKVCCALPCKERPARALNSRNNIGEPLEYCWIVRVPH